MSYFGILVKDGLSTIWLRGLVLKSFFICVGVLSVCRMIMPNHAVLRQHLLRHSTHTIHSKLCMIVHNAITSSSEHLWFHPSYCNFCLCCIHVQDVARGLSFERLASWSPSVGYAFLCISVRLCQLLLPGSLFFSFFLLVHSEPSSVSWLSVITLSKESGPRFTSQSHYFLFSLPVFFWGIFLIWEMRRGKESLTQAVRSSED